MQLYDTVEVIEDIDNFKKGSIGVIVELYNDKRVVLVEEAESISL